VSQEPQIRAAVVVVVQHVMLMFHHHKHLMTKQMDISNALLVEREAVEL
jgi:hypothetical protein